MLPRESWTLIHWLAVVRTVKIVPSRILLGKSGRLISHTLSGSYSLGVCIRKTVLRRRTAVAAAGAVAHNPKLQIDLFHNTSRSRRCAGARHRVSVIYHYHLGAISGSRQPHELWPRL